MSTGRPRSLLQGICARRTSERSRSAGSSRVNGLRGLADALRTTASVEGRGSGAGTLLAQQAQRLVTSDVVWDDLFKIPSAQILDEQGVHGVACPLDVRAEPGSRELRHPEDLLPADPGAASGGTPPACTEPVSSRW